MFTLIRFKTFYCLCIYFQIDFIIGREMIVGGIYKGVVSSIKEYGAFIEFNGGQHGLLHISELSHGAVCETCQVLVIYQVKCDNSFFIFPMWISFLI